MDDVGEKKVRQGLSSKVQDDRGRQEGGGRRRKDGCPCSLVEVELDATQYNTTNTTM